MKYLLNPLKLKLVIITRKRKVIKVVFIKNEEQVIQKIRAKLQQKFTLLTNREKCNQFNISLSPICLSSNFQLLYHYKLCKKKTKKHYNMYKISALT